MSSLPFLTSELQALSKEAGRRHADVKEAADKALALLKSSPETALSDLHENSGGKQPVLLAPIVLGCSTKNPKVTSIAVSGLQRLTGVRGAITESTVPIILTTLRSVLSQGVEIQLKILQTLVSLLTNCKDVHDELLAETLLISFKLLESKIGVVSSTAAATLRQLIMFVFENVDAEDRAAQKAKEDPAVPNFSVFTPRAGSDIDNTTSSEPHYLLPAARDAYLVFEDICLLVNGEQPSFLKLQNLPRTFGLELIESVLSDFSNVFVSHPELLHLLRTLLSPLLIRALAEKPTFSTTLRLMRVMYLLLKKFNDHLVMESEIFLCMFIKVVAPGETEGSGGHPLSSSMLPTHSKDGKNGGPHAAHSGSSPHWMRVLALEILRGLCGDFELLSKIWSRYDAPQGQDEQHCNPSSSMHTTSRHRESTKVPVFTSMITALNKLATEKPPSLGTGTAVTSGVVADPHTGEYTVSGVVDGIVGMAHQAATSVGVTGPSQGGLAMATATVKLQCIDQLDKADAPAIPETYIFLLALQCLNAIGEGFAAHVIPTYTNLMGRRPREGPEPLPAPPSIKFDSDLRKENVYDLLKTAYDMAEAAWPALLASLSFFLTTNLDDDLFTYTLSAFQQFTTTCGVLGLNTPRDAFLVSLCKFAVPPPIISNLASSDSSSTSSSRPQLNSVLSAGADALGLSTQSPQPMSLSTRNLLCLRSLIHIAQALAGSLEKTWFYVFEALQNADLVVRTETSRRQKKRSHPPPSSAPHSNALKTAPASHNSSTAVPTGSTSTNSRFVPSEQDEQAAHARAARLFETSKVLDDTGFRWFMIALCRLNAEMIGILTSELGELAALEPGGTSPAHKDADHVEGETNARQHKRSGINVIRSLRPGERSYAVTKLGDVCIMNMGRLTSREAELGWDIVVTHLLLVQHWQSAPAIVRLQAAEVFDKVVSSAAKECPDASEERQIYVQEQVLRALLKQVEPHNRSQVSTDVEIRQAGLDTLYKILEGQGHALLCGWSVVFQILQTACPDGSTLVAAGTSAETSASTAAKASQLVRVAFPSLQLICSDFLTALSAEECGMSIVTLAAFGRQKADVNVALTAGNLLWQVSDHLQVARRQTTESDVYLKLWMDLLHRLLELCRDPRQEVRDGAIQILWRSIELYGATLNQESWQNCLSGIIFPLLDSLDEGLSSLEQEDLPNNVEKTALGVPLPYKQWDDSKILAVTSAGTVFFNELSDNIAKLSSFEQVCEKFIEYMQRSFLHDRPAVATAAAKALEKMVSVRWEEAELVQSQQLAVLAWRAWLKIGYAIKNEKHGLTQQNLEFYTKVLASLQEHHHLAFTDDRIVDLLVVLKSVMTYPYSPDYRPDQDVMPPVQAAVVGAIGRLELSSATVVSAVLRDLAEYMTLAFTTLSETVKSPTLSAPPRLNQKVTYIALSKSCTGRILDIYQRFKEEPAIYETAIESVLAAYAIPLRLKYECPLPSRFGDDAPLWKTATQHFLQITRGIVQSLNMLNPSLSEETLANVWRQLLAGFRAILQADCRSVIDLPLDEQRMEEDFDLAVIVTLENDILGSLGNSSVPTDVIIALVRALCDASRLHEPAGGYPVNKSLSPTLTAVSSRDSADALRSGASGRVVSDYDIQGSSNTTLDGTTIDDEELPRERFAYWCLDLLFQMCDQAPKDKCLERRRVAVLALPLLFERCLSVLHHYLADAAVRGKVPFTRVREEELVSILAHLSTLQLDEGVFEAAYFQDDSVKALQEIEDGKRPFPNSATPTDLLSSAARRSSRAHLYELFPHFLDLISLPRLASNAARHTVPYAYLNFGQGRTSQGESQHAFARVGNDGRSLPSRAVDARVLVQACLRLVGEGLTGYAGPCSHAH